jgi:large-conductance mechanosensitive channel
VGWADLAETLMNLSLLAGACIQYAGFSQAWIDLIFDTVTGFLMIEALRKLDKARSRFSN